MEFLKTKKSKYPNVPITSYIETRLKRQKVEKLDNSIDFNQIKKKKEKDKKIMEEDIKRDEENKKHKQQIEEIKRKREERKTKKIDNNPIQQQGVSLSQSFGTNSTPLNTSFAAKVGRTYITPEGMQERQEEEKSKPRTIGKK